jgi:hypothetical protein
MVGVFKASYAITDTNVVPLVRPGAALLICLPKFTTHWCAACAVVQTDPAEHADKLTDDGRQRPVRRSHLHERTIILDWTG